jgi:hypothetical protein
MSLIVKNHNVESFSSFFSRDTVPLGRIIGIFSENHILPFSSFTMFYDEKVTQTHKIETFAWRRFSNIFSRDTVPVGRIIGIFSENKIGY